MIFFVTQYWIFGINVDKKAADTTKPLPQLIEFLIKFIRLAFLMTSSVIMPPFARLIMSLMKASASPLIPSSSACAMNLSGFFLFDKLLQFPAVGGD